MKKKFAQLFAFWFSMLLKGIPFFEYMTTRFSTEDLAKRVSLV